MLLTKFTYIVDQVGPGVTITLTRPEDSGTKVFSIASSNSAGRVKSFMDSVTDQLASDYFPKIKRNDQK